MNKEEDDDGDDDEQMMIQQQGGQTVVSPYAASALGPHPQGGPYAMASAVAGGYRRFEFPYKLHQLLDEAASEGNQHIVSWLPLGKSFRVHSRRDFEMFIAPRYFSSPTFPPKFRSFQRQLSIYGFTMKKDRASEDFGAYFHPLFIQGKPDLCVQMERQKIKGNRKRRSRKDKLNTVTRENNIIKGDHAVDISFPLTTTSPMSMLNRAADSTKEQGKSFMESATSISSAGKLMQNSSQGGGSIPGSIPGMMMAQEDADPGGVLEGTKPTYMGDVVIMPGASSPAADNRIIVPPQRGSVSGKQLSTGEPTASATCSTSYIRQQHDLLLFASSANAFLDMYDAADIAREEQTARSVSSSCDRTSVNNSNTAAPAGSTAMMIHSKPPSQARSPSVTTDQAGLQQQPLDEEVSSNTMAANLETTTTTMREISMATTPRPIAAFLSAAAFNEGMLVHSSRQDRSPVAEEGENLGLIQQLHPHYYHSDLALVPGEDHRDVDENSATISVMKIINASPAGALMQNDDHEDGPTAIRAESLFSTLEHALPDNSSEEETLY